MELADGETLAERIRRGPIPVDESLGIAKQIAEALEAAHEKGIIHRDLKPANVKMSPEGKVKVLDFGLAKAFEGDGVNKDPSNSPTLSQAATMQGVILGTAAYMSPEQARGRLVDKRTDIWAFGAVLYELLTGKQAFSGEDVTEMVAAVVKSEPDWNRLPEATPLSIRTLLRRCLRKDRRQRISDATDVRIEIEDAIAALKDPGVTQAAPGTRGWRQRWTQAIAAVVILTTIAFVIGFMLRTPRQVGALVRFSVAPPPDAVRRVGTVFAVSPDGQLLAFTADGADGVPRIFIRHIDTTEAQSLAGTDRATFMFWSPDSRSLAFSRERGLYRSDLGTSPPKRLCDVPVNSIRGGTWGSAGVIVFATGSGGLVRVPDTGGTPTPVTTLDAGAKEVAHLGPWFLPDGRHLLFLALAGATRGVIWATSIDNPARTRITESSGAAAYAAGWLLSTTDAPRSLIAQRFNPERLTLQGTPQPVRDQLGLATSAGYPGFDVSASGTLVVDRPPPIMEQLAWMDRTARTVATVGPRASISSFALAQDQHRVVAEVLDNDAAKRDLWLFDTGREDGTRLTYEGRLTRPLWALDGRHIYFTQVNGAGPDLRTLAIGATATTAFENPGPFAHFEDVTRDGRYVLFKSSTSEIWIQAAGSAERRALVQGPFSATQPRVSPDGRWLAYTLSLPSGSEVFVQPFDRPGDRIQVSVKGGAGPIWRDDGRELYYESPEGLMAVPMTDRGDALETGTPQKLFSIHTQGLTPQRPHNVEVAAHGQKFLVSTIVGDSDNVPLEVTLNWMSGLKE
jgi:Tol biopolymer transport system component